MPLSTAEPAPQRSFRCDNEMPRLVASSVPWRSLPDLRGPKIAHRNLSKSPVGTELDSKGQPSSPPQPCKATVDWAPCQATTQAPSGRLEEHRRPTLQPCAVIHWLFAKQDVWRRAPMSIRARPARCPIALLARQQRHSHQLGIERTSTPREHQSRRTGSNDVDRNAHAGPQVPWPWYRTQRPRWRPFIVCQGVRSDISRKWR